jgi:hypothetical protein
VCLVEGCSLSVSIVALCSPVTSSTSPLGSSLLGASSSESSSSASPLGLALTSFSGEVAVLRGEDKEAKLIFWPRKLARTYMASYLRPGEAVSSWNSVRVQQNP